MNAQELFFKDGQSANVWYCSTCRIVAMLQSTADECCKLHTCRYCGEIVLSPHCTNHPACVTLNTIKKATKLDSWDGWVYWEDRYFSNLSSLIEEFTEIDILIPEYVFVCKPDPFDPPGIEWICEKSCYDPYDGDNERITPESYDDLSIALENFRSANQHIVSYYPDYKRMVRVREAIK